MAVKSKPTLIGTMQRVAGVPDVKALEIELRDRLTRIEAKLNKLLGIPSDE